MCMKWSSSTVIACYSLNGNLVKTYRSAKDASRCRNLHSRTIDKAIRENKIIRNMMWRRFPVDEVPTSIEPYVQKEINCSAKPVALLDDNGSIVETYKSLKEAAKVNGVDPHTVRDMLYGKTKTAKGKTYRFLTLEEASDFGIKINHYFGEIKIRQYSLDGELIKTYDSITKAAKKIRVDPSSIWLCTKGSVKTVKGYYWVVDNEHAEEEITKLLNRKKYFYSSVVQLDSYGKVIAKYNSTTEASKVTGISGKSIAQAIRRNETAGGYYWKGEK